MRLAICLDCGCCFTPDRIYERVCNECYTRPKRARPVLCEIEESYGRCLGYFKGVCEACLDFCAAEDWVGWRAVDECEWWKGMGSTGNEDGRSDGTRIH
jgi:hypothetical protein